MSNIFTLYQQADGTKIKPAAFRVLFGGNVFRLDHANREVTRNADKRHCANATTALD